MNGEKKKPVAQQAYDELAEAYAAHVDTKPHNAYYERPATLSLLPDVRGKWVLDAGCGPGVYSEWLVNQGAEVVAFDGNARMVEFARKRLGERVQVFQANLEGALDFLSDVSFDVIVCPLAMDYVEDWEPTFREFHRVIKTGGALVFSMEHPHPKFESHRDTSDYFSVELIEYTWRGFGKPVSVASYRRPLSGVINPLINAGFTLDRVLEPQPTDEFKEVEPKDYEELLRNPGFLCIRAVKI